MLEQAPIGRRDTEREARAAPLRGRPHPAARARRRPRQSPRSGLRLSTGTKVGVFSCLLRSYLPSLHGPSSRILTPRASRTPIHWRLIPSAQLRECPAAIREPRPRGSRPLEHNPRTSTFGWVTRSPRETGRGPSGSTPFSAMIWAAISRIACSAPAKCSRQYVSQLVDGLHSFANRSHSSSLEPLPSALSICRQAPASGNAKARASFSTRRRRRPASSTPFSRRRTTLTSGGGTRTAVLHQRVLVAMSCDGGWMVCPSS